MSINLLRNARIRNSRQCRYDTNEGYSVIWDADDDFKGYTSFEDVTARLVSNGSYFMITTTASGYISTAEDIVSIDAGVYTTLKVNMRVEPGEFHVIPTKGRIQYKVSDDVDWDSEKIKDFDIIADNAYREYSIDMSLDEEWQGDVVRLKIFPILDGDSGQQIFLRSVKATSPVVFSCSTRHNTPVCDRFTDYEHVCPFRGAGATVVSSSVSERLTIGKGVNDKLIVNINEFGRQALTLEPVVNATLDTISRDFEYKLNLLGIGGYANAVVDVVNNSFVIEADTPEASSTIEILEPAVASAGVTLGFFNSEGEVIYTSTEGEQAASRYEPEGTYRVSRSDLDQFYVAEDIDEAGVFSMEPDRWAPQGGREDYLYVARDTTIDFDEKTLIDYNNPITENGVLTKAYFSGTAHQDTEFRVYRQRLDGSIHYVGGVNFGSSVDNNTSKLFEVDCSIRVRKGDLVGLYDASVHFGRDTQTSNFSYYLYDGNLLTSTAGFELQGQGEDGAPIFCRGREKTNKAALVLEFDDLEPIESLEIEATEDTPIEEMRLTDVQSGGLNGGPSVTGYTGYGLDGTKAPEWENLDAITDKDQLDNNGTTLTAYPLWLDGLDPENYDYTEAGIVIDFAPGIDVLFNVHKVVVNFRSESNIKHFSLDYPQNTNLLGTVRTWQTVTPTFSQVSVDGAVSPTTRYFYSNPAWVTVENYSEDYVSLRYRTIEFLFDSVSTRAIRYRGYLNRTSTVVDYTSTDLADFPIYIDPGVQEIVVYGRSQPVKNLADNFSLLSSTDGEVYTSHPDEDSLSSTRTRFTVGYPVKYLKLIIEPTTILTVNSLFAHISREDFLVTTNKDSTDEHSLNAPKNSPESVVDKITVVNETEETSNYYVDIAEEHNKDTGVLLWNKLGSAEELANSEYGPGGIVYKRPNFNFTIQNVALFAPAYIMDPNFLRNSPCYVSYDDQATWERIGQTVVNGSLIDYVTNGTAGYQTYPKVYIAIDCEDFYDFESVTPVNASIGRYDTGWDTTVFYSTANVDNPSDIPDTGSGEWSTNQYGARWILMSVEATFLPGSKSLAYIKPVLEPLSQRNEGKIPWVLEERLTNGIAGTRPYGDFWEDWNDPGRITYYCVDLEKRFDIEYVCLGPLLTDYSIDSDSFWERSNALNGVGGISSDIAFSGTFNDNPNRVKWSGFAQPPSGGDRWVLVRSYLCDEIGVKVNEDRSLNKTVFEVDRWWSGRNLTPYVNEDTYCVPFGSIMVDYPESTTSYDYLKLVAPLGYDNDLKPRDAISFCLYVEDVNQIDKDYGHFRLGKATSETSTFNNQVASEDEDNFYVWDFDTVSSGIVSGWNFITLQFFRNNEVGDTRFIENLSGATLSSKRRSRMYNFKFQFRGTGTNDSFKVGLDNLEVLRSYYPESEYGTSVYIAGEDYLKFPINNFNHVQGCLEFFLDPDWSKDTNCNSCTDLVTNTIFRFQNNFGYYITMMMSTAGIQIFLSNGTDTLAHLDDSYGSIISGTRHHIALTWDFREESSSLFQFFIDGVLSSEYFRSSLTVDFDLRGMTNTYLIFGGKTWEGYSTREVTGLDGALDNVKLYNYAKKDFTDSLTIEGFKTLKKSTELLQLSLDGVNFYGYEDRGAGIPLLVRNVTPGDSFDVYLKARGLSTLQDGEKNRKTLLEIVRSHAG